MNSGVTAFQLEIRNASNWINVHLMLQLDEKNARIYSDHWPMWQWICVFNGCISLINVKQDLCCGVTLEGAFGSLCFWPSQGGTFGRRTWQRGRPSATSPTSCHVNSIYLSATVRCISRWIVVSACRRWHEWVCSSSLPAAVTGTSLRLGP